MTTVDIIIPSYNHARYVAAAVRSALAQTHPATAIVVVDDGSTDDTAAALAPFGDSITVLRQANAGVSAARNAGLAATGSELVAFLDADDEWEPEKLRLQVEAFAADPAVGLVHVGLTFIDADGLPLGEELDGLEGHVADDLLEFRRGVVLGGGSGFAVRRSALEEIGGFDLELSTSADWDVFYRIARRHPIAFLRRPLLRYRLHGSNMHGNIPVMERDMRRAFQKAFAEPGPHQRLRRRSYGRLHLVLSGSYAERHRWGPALRHAALAGMLDPAGIPRIAVTPLRRLRRR